MTVAYYDKLKANLVSIPTPARKGYVVVVTIAIVIDISVSIHTPARGVTGNYIIHFARIDNKKFSDILDFLKIITPSNNRFDNSIKKGILYNKEKNMLKNEALDLLKNSNLMAPEDSNGDPVYRHIGEYSETETTHNWVIYWCSPEEPDDRSYCFMYFVNKNTKEVSRASAPLTEDELKYIRETAAQ